MIGEIFDKVCTRAARSFQENVQTTLIPAGGAAIVRVPRRGAGQLRAGRSLDLPRLQQGRAGDAQGRRAREQGDLFRQGSRRGVPRRSRGAEPRARSTAATEAAAAGTLTQERADQGRPGAVRRHLLGVPPGQRPGLPGVFPPLAKSDFLAADPKRAIDIVLHGLTGKVTVNGKEYNSVMPPMSQLNDDEIANILHLRAQQLGQPGRPHHQGRSRRSAARRRHPRRGERRRMTDAPARRGRCCSRCPPPARSPAARRGSRAARRHVPLAR